VKNTDRLGYGYAKFCVSRIWIRIRKFLARIRSGVSRIRGVIFRHNFFNIFINIFFYNRKVEIDNSKSITRNRKLEIENSKSFKNSKSKTDFLDFEKKKSPKKNWRIRAYPGVYWYAGKISIRIRHMAYFSQH